MPMPMLPSARMTIRFKLVPVRNCRPLRVDPLLKMMPALTVLLELPKRIPFSLATGVNNET